MCGLLLIMAIDYDEEQFSVMSMRVSLILFTTKSLIITIVGDIFLPSSLDYCKVMQGENPKIAITKIGAQIIQYC